MRLRTPPPPLLHPLAHPLRFLLLPSPLSPPAHLPPPPSSNTKLLYSNLNEAAVSYLTSFSTPSLPDSLAFVKGQHLSLGTLDGEGGGEARDMRCVSVSWGARV